MASPHAADLKIHGLDGVHGFKWVRWSPRGPKDVVLRDPGCLRGQKGVLSGSYLQ